MNNKIVSILIILILIVGGFFLFNNKTTAPTDIEETEITGGMPVPGEEVDETVSIREFTVDAKNFSFSLATMEVNIGDTVKITLKSSEGTHNLKIDEFNASTKTLQALEEETIEFVASEAGSFEYYCSIGNHRAQGMVGTLVVK